MMAADMNDDPLERSQQDHLTREGVLHVIAVRAMLRAVRQMKDETEQQKEPAGDE